MDRRRRSRSRRRDQGPRDRKGGRNLKDIAGEVNADVDPDADICKFCGSPEECTWGKESNFCSDTCYRAAGFGIAAYNWDVDDVQDWMQQSGVGKFARALRVDGSTLCTTFNEGNLRRAGVEKKKAKILMADVDWLRQGIWFQPEPPRTVVPLEIVSEKANRSKGWSLFVDDPKRRSYGAVNKKAVPDQLAWKWFEQLHDQLPWKDLIDTKYQAEGQVAPRRTAFVVAKGCGCVYRYAGVVVQPLKEPDYLAKIREKCIELCGFDAKCQPNSMNANLYRDGQDSVGWHTDNEEVFEGEYQDICILSLSLGAGRKFQVKRQSSTLNPSPETTTVTLGHGDLCTMEGMFQRYYLHGVPKAPAEKSARINLTWRWITKHNHDDGCTMRGTGNA